MKKNHQFDRRDLLPAVAIISLVVLIAFLGLKDVPKNYNSNDKDLLAKCEMLVSDYTEVDLGGVYPKFSRTGGGGAHGYHQNVVFWKNDEQGVDVKCIGRKRNKLDVLKIDGFVVNGEDLTRLIRLKEQE